MITSHIIKIASRNPNVDHTISVVLYIKIDFKMIYYTSNFIFNSQYISYFQLRKQLNEVELHKLTDKLTNKHLAKIYTTGQKWTQVDTSGHFWTLVDTHGHLWTQMDSSGHLWTQMDAIGHKLTN